MDISQEDLEIIRTTPMINLECEMFKKAVVVFVNGMKNDLKVMNVKIDQLGDTQIGSELRINSQIEKLEQRVNEIDSLKHNINNQLSELIDNE